MKKFGWELISIFILYIIADVYTTHHNLQLGHDEASMLILTFYNYYGVYSIIFLKLIIFSYICLFGYFTNTFHFEIRNKTIHFRMFWIIFYIISSIVIISICVNNIILSIFGIGLLDDILL